MPQLHVQLCRGHNSEFFSYVSQPQPIFHVVFPLFFVHLH